MGKIMLNESALQEVETIVESSTLKALDFEGVKALLESEGALISESKLAPAIKMMQLQEKFINESNFSANVEPYTKKLQPLLRRVIPGLLAMEIAGVQPVESPDSSVYAIKSRYAGNKTNGIIGNTAKLIVFTGTTAVAVGNTITAASGATGTVKYVETGKLIVDTITGTFVEGEEFDVGASFTNDGNELTISAIYSTETAFKQILKNYSGPYTTANGEVLGDSMNQIKVTIEKLPVTVKTRALKAEFTQELVQDMQAMHGAAADAELMNFLETEINLDLDREIIETYQTVATALPDFAVATATSSQGRWNMEMYAGLWQRILKSANNLASKNRRGKGNILVATAGTISALEALGKFRTTAYETSVQTGINHAQTFVGVLSNGMKVYQDHFASEDYAMVIYKGNDSQMDAGVIFAPFAPIQFVDAINATTLQPVIGVKSRYGLVANSLMDDGAGSGYAEYFTVDFTNTPLA